MGVWMHSIKIKKNKNQMVLLLWEIAKVNK